jgi:MFS family permease
MKINVDKSFQVCGNNNRYQKFFFLVVALTWFSVDFISILFPILELMPNFICKNSSGWQDCTEEEYCQIENMADRKAIVIYSNIITYFDLYCKKTLVMAVGVIYTLGVFMGVIVSSKFCDKLGRKPVLLMNQFLFACGGIAITFAPNVYFLFGILFFIGIASAGGTMVSFLFIYEVLAPNMRSVYGTLINSSFAVAGIVYFTLFYYIKDWKIIAYTCTVTDILSGFLILVYFTESPRFLISQGKIEKGLKALYKIAKKNGKSRDFYKYLMSDLSIEQNYKENIFPQGERYDDSINGDLNENENSFSNNANFNDSKTSTLVQTPETIKMSIEEIVKDIRKDSVSCHESGVKEEPFLNKSASGIVFTKEDQNINVKSPTIKKEPGFLALIKYKSIRASFLICCFLWFAISFTYYGIGMSIKNNKDSVFSDGYVVYTAEGISYIITGIMISISFFGRVRTISIMIGICSISSAAYFFLRQFEFEPYDKIALFLSRFGVTASYSIMYTYSTEVYPTSIRAKGLGVNTIFGRLSCLMVPVIVELINPFPIFAVLCVIGFFLTLSLQETLGNELEDEILEEKMRKVSVIDSTSFNKN